MCGGRKLCFHFPSEVPNGWLPFYLILYFWQLQELNTLSQSQSWVRNISISNTNHWSYSIIFCLVKMESVLQVTVFWNPFMGGTIFFYFIKYFLPTITNSVIKIKEGFKKQSRLLLPVIFRKKMIIWYSDFISTDKWWLNSFNILC